VVAADADAVALQVADGDHEGLRASFG